MLKLAQRMTDNFCAGVCASAAQKWRRLDEWRGGGEGGGSAGTGGAAGEGEEKVRMMARQSVRAPGEPPGVVLSATTSVRLPATSPQRVFDYLRDEQRRGEWDILANGEAMQEMDHIAKGQHHGNAVSLLRPNVSTTGSLLFTAIFTIAILNELSLGLLFGTTLKCNTVILVCLDGCKVCVKFL
jgi:homeobox-leucine zipper protein